MQVHNATGVQLTYWFDDLAAEKHRVAPDAVAGDLWPFPRNESDRQLRVVRAADENGALLFCHAYSYAEVAKSYRVELERGKLDCP